MNEKMYDAFCKLMSVHDRFNGEESRRGSTHQVHGRISVFSNKNKKNTKAHSQP